jgi:uncharacterized delta-60 repeat protein
MKSKSHATGVNGKIKNIAVQPDGKVLVQGDFTKLRGKKLPGFGRLNPDGSLDEAFSFHTDGTIWSFAVQRDGKILIGGNFSWISGEERPFLGRLNQDGSLDSSFYPFGTSYNHLTRGLTKVETIDVRSDGLIYFSMGGLKNLMIGWMDSTGENISFLSQKELGEETDLSKQLGLIKMELLATVEQSDGKSIFAGKFNELIKEPPDNIFRLNRDGNIDNSYNPRTNTVAIWDIALLGDDKLLFSCNEDSFKLVNTYIKKLNPDGYVDSSFSVQPNDSIFRILVEADEKILIGGRFTKVNKKRCKYLGRLNPDGSVDTSFNPGPNKMVHAITSDSDGKILVGGNFTKIGGEKRQRLARLNPDGTVDTSFE